MTKLNLGTGRTMDPATTWAHNGYYGGCTDQCPDDCEGEGDNWHVGCSVEDTADSPPRAGNINRKGTTHGRQGPHHAEDHERPSNQ